MAPTHWRTARIARHLERRGLLVRDLESSHLTRTPSEDAALEILQGHSITYRIAVGPHEGRLSLTPQGRVRYTLKTPYRDGTTHMVFSPVDFMARLAAVKPKPPVHLMRYHPDIRIGCCQGT